MFGIQNREIIESQWEIGRDGEQILVGVASCSKILLLNLDLGELHQCGNSLVLLDESVELCDRLFLPVGSDVDLSEQQVCRFELRIQFDRFQQVLLGVGKIPLGEINLAPKAPCLRQLGVNLDLLVNPRQCACSLVSSLLLSGATMSQQSSLTQSAHSVRQVLTAYTNRAQANNCCCPREIQQ